MISNEGKRAHGPEINTSLAEKNSQQTGTRRTTEHSIKERNVRPRQHLPPRSLGEQQGHVYRARAVHVTLTLHKSHIRCPVGTGKKQPPGDSQRARRRSIAQGTKVPHDGPAEALVRLEAGTKVRQACRWPACARYLQDRKKKQVADHIRGAADHTENTSAKTEAAYFTQKQHQANTSHVQLSRSQCAACTAAVLQPFSSPPVFISQQCFTRACVPTARGGVHHRPLEFTPGTLEPKNPLEMRVHSLYAPCKYNNSHCPGALHVQGRRE
jgi:hypothetical protein